MCRQFNSVLAHHKNQGVSQCLVSPFFFLLLFSPHLLPTLGNSMPLFLRETVFLVQADNLDRRSPDRVTPKSFHPAGCSDRSPYPIQAQPRFVPRKVAPVAGAAVPLAERRAALEREAAYLGGDGKPYSRGLGGDTTPATARLIVRLPCYDSPGWPRLNNSPPV